MGIKETRMQKFVEMENFIKENDWVNCDNNAMFLLFSLPDTSKQRVFLKDYIDNIRMITQGELRLLSEILPTIKSVFQREQLKTNMMYEIERWRVTNVYHKFLQVFLRDDLLEKEQKPGK